MINPDATSVTFTSLGKQYHYVYRISPPDSIQGKVLALLAQKYLHGSKGKTVVFAGRNDPYGTGLADFFNKNWKKMSGKVQTPYLSDPSQASYDSEAAQIVGAERGKLTRESATIVERLGPDARHDSDPRAQDAQLLGELALVLVVTRKNDGDPLEEMR
jgi:hypothetical protein